MSGCDGGCDDDEPVSPCEIMRKKKKGFMVQTDYDSPTFRPRIVETPCTSGGGACPAPSPPSPPPCGGGGFEEETPSCCAPPGCPQCPEPCCPVRAKKCCPPPPGPPTPPPIDFGGDFDDEYDEYGAGAGADYDYDDEGYDQ